MRFIAKETNGKSYDSYKYSFDSIGLPSIEYDDEHETNIQWKEKGETIKYNEYIKLKVMADRIHQTHEESILKYFLDGSRHVYKVDDISYNKQVYPVVAGQVGVGCCCRIDKVIKPFSFYRKYVIVMPDKAYRDGWDDKAYFANITKKVNETEQLKRLGVQFDEIIPYKANKNGLNGTKLDDVAVSKVQDYMVEHEKIMVAELVKKNCLNQDSFLVKDGSLEYSDVSTARNEDLRSLQKIRNNYRFVIGVSKSFNPESCKDYKGNANSDYIANLPVFCRTPVARFKNPQFLGDNEFAVWYVRIRDRQKSLTPFDGVIKVEKILMDDEIEDGVDSDTVDLISANLINERNPTCYGSDKRWANHIYPIYLTETFIKSKYLSGNIFLSLF